MYRNTNVSASVASVLKITALSRRAAGRQVGPRVVRHGDAAEEDGDDARELQELRRRVRAGTARSSPATSRRARGARARRSHQTPRKNAAASTANAAPVAVLPRNTKRKYPTLSKTRTTLEAKPLSAKSSNVRYSTMATASFNTDSPNTSANKSGLTPSSWNTASTDTGSVAETSAPNTSACVMDSAVTSPIAPHTQQNTPTTIVEMSVPPNASAQIPSKFGRSSWSPAKNRSRR